MSGALNRVVARLCRGARSLERALLVQHCMLCTAPSGDQPVCAPCTSGLEQLPPHCPCCAMPSPAGSVCGTCSTSAPWFDRTVAAWPYRFPLDRLVQALKFHARLQLAPWFASNLAERLPPFDVVMGLPLHRRRLAERGFNQAHEIARRIAPLRGVQVLSSGFERHRATGEQSHMPHDARAANVRGAFACTLRLHGVRVAVVDDVMTTGATLNEFAATLKRAGAAQVINCVVARTLF